MADLLSEKKQQVAAIIATLQTKGQQLTDEELQHMQLTTDALRARAGDHEHHSDHAKA